MIREFDFAKREQIRKVADKPAAMAVAPVDTEAKFQANMFDGRLELALVRIENLDNVKRRDTIQSQRKSFETQEANIGLFFRTLGSMAVNNGMDMYEKTIAS